MLTVDGSEVLSFAQRMREVPKELRPELRRSIANGAELIASRARSNASWSSRIPDAISVRVSFAQSDAVQVVVNSDKAPHARAFEGIANQTGAGMFRHPVFGRDTWVEEPTRPFLRPAVRDTEREAVREIESALAIAFRNL